MFLVGEGATLMAMVYMITDLKCGQMGAGGDEHRPIAIYTLLQYRHKEIYTTCKKPATFYARQLYILNQLTVQ